MTLITRIEAAGPEDQRALLVEAWDIIHPRSTAFDLDKWHRFTGMITHFAYLSAAEMLVPEGWGWGAGNCSEKDDSWASVTSPHGDCLDYDAYASTPALALLAAILRAREA